MNNQALQPEQRTDQTNSLSIRWIILVSSALAGLVYIFIGTLLELPYNNKIPAVIIIFVWSATVFLTRRGLWKIHISSTALFLYSSILICNTLGKTWYLYDKLYWILLAYTLGILIMKVDFGTWVYSIPFYIVVFTFLGGYYILKVDIDSFYSFNRNVLAMYIYSFASLSIIPVLVKARLSIIKEVITIILLVFTEFLTRSRAGLLVSILYSLVVLVYLGLSLRKRVKFTLSRGQTLSVIGILILGVGIFLWFIWWTIGNSRLATQGLGSNGRMAIYLTYFKNIDLNGFFFGDASIIQMVHHPHMHNSILQLLVSSGFIGTLPWLVILLIAFIRLLKISYTLIALFLLLFIYSSVEYFTLYKFGDFALIPLLVIAFTTVKTQSGKESLS